MISPKRLKEKRIRACKHLVLMREHDDESGLPESYWRCADCPGEFQLVSKVAPILTKDAVRVREALGERA